jgi:TatD DNase family protein
MGLIDSHAHLTFPELRGRVDEVLARGVQAGVDRIITIGCTLDDTKAAMGLAERYPGRVFAGGGFHPHEADGVTEAELEQMAELWRHPCIVGIGEIGLDYHHKFADRGRQREVFACQLAPASPFSHPIIIHCREAFDDCLPILLDHGYENRPVVFHCFTGTPGEAARVAKHGWRLSFTGVVTFSNSTRLQEIARHYPADALMIESDSPYLSPAPVRGKRPNEPAYLAHTARFLADLRGVAYEELVEQSARNTERFFNLARV